MSILIKGLFGKDMPMPQEGYVDIRIHFKSGKLKRVTMPTGEDPFYATFEVEKLPPHGRLIDADEPMTKISTMMQEPDYQHEGEDWMVGLIMARDAIDEAPTVVEGSET